MSLHARERNGNRFKIWPGMIFALIGLNVCVVGVTVYFAFSDRSFSIEPGYYQQAVAWNETARQRQINSELGWTLKMAHQQEAGSGDISMTADLADRDGKPIEQALVVSLTFPSLRAADRSSLTWTETQPGTYQTTLHGVHPGLWEFRFTVRRGDVVFTSIMEHNIEDQPGDQR